MNANESGKARILVGVDGSECSKNALRWAARLAGPMGAGIDAIYAWAPVTTYGWAALPMEYSPRIEVEKLLNKAVDETFGSDRPADLRLRAIEGLPAATLIAEGRKALMIIVGSRGHGGFAGLLLGSVSAKVAEHAPCPVLVIHGTSAEPPAR